jgi:hypothetical protein
MVGVCGKNIYFNKKTPYFGSHNYKGVKLRPLIITVLQGIWIKKQSQHLIIKK